MRKTFIFRACLHIRLLMKTSGLLTVIFALLAVSGCASVDMAPTAASAEAKRFEPPQPGKAGLYIYRNSFVGKALKKTLWVDGRCIGESAPDVFFYTQVEGGKTHRVETESEFSPNALDVHMDSGRNYFLRQYIKLGVFVGGANLEQVGEERGKKDIQDLRMARLTGCDLQSVMPSETNPLPASAPMLTLPAPVATSGVKKVGVAPVSLPIMGTRPDLYYFKK